MQYRSRRSAFSAAIVQAKKVRYGKIFVLAWGVVLVIVSVQEGANIYTLLRDLTGDTPSGRRVSYHYGDELGELKSFRLIYNNAIRVEGQRKDTKQAVNTHLRALHTVKVR